MASLLELIVSGSLRGIAPGSSAEDVRRAFGEPPDVSASRDPTILKFDALEVTVRGGLVDLLHVELAEPLPPFVDADGLSEGTTREVLEERLSSQGIRCEPYEPLTFRGSQTSVRSVPAQAVVVFDGAGRLSSISSSAN